MAPREEGASCKARPRRIRATTVDSPRHAVHHRTGTEGFFGGKFISLHSDRLDPAMRPLLTEGSGGTATSGTDAQQHRSFGSVEDVYLARFAASEVFAGAVFSAAGHAPASKGPFQAPSRAQSPAERSETQRGYVASHQRWLPDEQSWRPVSCSRRRQSVLPAAATPARADGSCSH